MGGTRASRLEENPDYRVYFFDATGRIIDFLDLDNFRERDAIEKIKTIQHKFTVELWNGDRKICRSSGKLNVIGIKLVLKNILFTNPSSSLAGHSHPVIQRKKNRL